MLGQRLPGNDYTRLRFRRELYALIPYYGAPTLFLTVNPGDIYSAALCYFAGVTKLDRAAQSRDGLDALCDEIGFDDHERAKLDQHFVTTDKTLAEDLPSLEERAKLIAGDPVASADFFHTLIKAILDYMVGSSQHSRSPNRRFGVLGNINSYYGTIESQGRGSLHLHLLVWIRHAPSHSELEQRMKDPSYLKQLFAYLEDVVCGMQRPNMTCLGSDESSTTRSVIVMRLHTE
jgi:hypothetical protein